MLPKRLDLNENAKTYSFAFHFTAQLLHVCQVLALETDLDLSICVFLELQYVLVIVLSTVGISQLSDSVHAMLILSTYCKLNGRFVYCLIIILFF